MGCTSPLVISLGHSIGTEYPQVYKKKHILWQNLKSGILQNLENRLIEKLILVIKYPHDFIITKERLVTNKLICV